MDTEAVALNAAELGAKEAVAQFNLWSAKLAEAKAAKARAERLVDGYSRMLDGLSVIHPDLSELATAGEAKAPGSATARIANLGLTLNTSTIDESPTVHGSVPITRISAPGAPVSSTKVVRAILTELGPDVRATTRDVLAEIEQRGIKLDSDNPLPVVRKALAYSVEKGWINSADRDGRTKVYWIKTEADASPDNDSGPADGAGPGEASDEGASSQENVVTGAFGPSPPVR